MYLLYNSWVRNLMRYKFWKFLITFLSITSYETSKYFNFLHSLNSKTLSKILTCSGVFSFAYFYWKLLCLQITTHISFFFFIYNIQINLSSFIFVIIFICYFSRSINYVISRNQISKSFPTQPKIFCLFFYFFYLCWNLKV